MSKTDRKRRVRGVVKRDASQAVIEREDSPVNLLELERPDFLSLVKNPANRMPFAIVRNAEGKVKRVRNSDSTALLSITVDRELSGTDLSDVMGGFGITEDEYEVAVREGNTYMSRKSRSEGADPITMTIATGVTAEVDRNVINKSQKRSDSVVDTPSLTVVKIKFTSEDTTVAKAKQWLESKSIEFNDADVFSVAGQTVYVRHDYEDNVELKEVSIEEGVGVVLAHTASDDIPHVIYRSIIEEAYGNYGWGHIDFFQAMVDEQFSQDARSAMRWLEDVLDNIIFYSGLPLSDRLSLVENATGEFLAWMTALMVSLPRQVLTINSVDLQSQGDVVNREESSTNSNEIKETADMSTVDKAKQDSKAVERTDVEVLDTQAESTDGQEVTETVVREEAEMVTMSRADLDAAIASAVATANAVQTRSDEVVTEEVADPSIAAMTAAMTAALQPVITRMDAIEAEAKKTVVRDDSSDDDENGASDDTVSGGRVTRSDENDWGRGAITGFGRASRVLGSGKRG